MKTIQRRVMEISQISSKANASQYFNQFNFKGIVEDNNIFAIDQESCRDAQNIFVSFDDRLKSRPTLQKDDLPELFSSLPYLDYDLIDIEQFGSNKVYVFKHSGTYDLIFVEENELTYCELTGLSEYKLASIEHYIVCLNNINAKLIDLSTYENYGQLHISGSSALYPIGSKEAYIGYYIKIGDEYELITNENYNTEIVYTDEGVFASKENYIGYFINTQDDVYLLVTADNYNDITDLVVNSSHAYSLPDAYKYKWVPLSDYTYIPTTEITTGNSTKQTEDSNSFIGQTKHQYNWSNSSQPLLPTGNADITLITVNGKQELGEFTDANINTDYRILKKLNIDVGLYNNISIVKDTICIAYDSYFKISFNGGETFENIYYDNNTGYMCGIYTLSDDGEYFFYVNTDGVHRCNLSNFTWNEVIKCSSNSGVIKRYGGKYHFFDGTTFAFTCGDNSMGAKNDLLYLKGPGVITDDYDYSDIDYTYKLGSIERVYIETITFAIMSNVSFSSLKVRVINGKTIILLGSTRYDNKSGIMVYDYTLSSQVNNQNIGLVLVNYEVSDFNVGFSIGFEIDSILDTGVNNYSFTAIVRAGNYFQTAYTVYDFTCQLSISISGSTITPTWNNTENMEIGIGDYSSTGELLEACKLDGGYIKSYSDGTTYVYQYMSEQWTSLFVSNVHKIIPVGDDFYLLARDENNNYYLYTNKLYSNSINDEEDVAQIVYIVGSVGSYNKVPQVTYSDTELYLGNGSTLQITQNTKDIDDNTKTLFYLPNINDQKFIDEITGMINISATEVAIFFKDNIVICSKVQDENMSAGYRYDYYNTKLSVGTRLGDSIINTLEGQYTIFPTIRGLAIMNYQAFMATTDQVVEYITDHIPALWGLFYENSTMIKIMQWRTYLVLTNGSGNMLLYNLTSNSWWRWQIPKNVYRVMTDQERLWCIDNLLYRFKDQRELKTDGTLEQRRYFDFSETENGSEINWFIKSQPLHFKAPTHYKNIKQIIFQFYDIDETTSYDKTLDAQIKLYRKKITITEPETIDFKIEGLRTFVKRFNYWKINELQWAISNDTDTIMPAQFEINNVSIKYEIGDEVR